MVNHSKQSRYEDVLAVLRDGNPRSTNEIRKELRTRNINISFQGIDKHLKKMLERKEVAFLGNTRNNKELITEIYGKVQYKKIKGYYVHTPLAARLHQRLCSFVQRFQEQERYQKQINLITDTCRALEIAEQHQKHQYTSHKLIREALKERDGNKHRLTKEFVVGQITANKENVQKYAEKVPKLRINFSGVQINGKPYCYIGDELVPLQKLLNFIGLLEMTPYMKFLAVRDEQNRKEHTARIIEAMQELFVMIVRDSQVKV